MRDEKDDGALIDPAQEQRPIGETATHTSHVDEVEVFRWIHPFALCIVDLEDTGTCQNDRGTEIHGDGCHQRSPIRGRPVCTCQHAKLAS